jgi:hypothetical protein
MWKHSRALLRPSFARENVNNLDATAQSADALIRILGEADPKTGWTTGQDMLPLFFCFTLDTAMEFLFGESVGALSAYGRANGKTVTFPVGSGDEGKEGFYGGAVAASSEFSDALRVANEGTVSRLRLGNLYWLSDGLEFRKSIRIVKRFVGGFVEKTLARVEVEGQAVEGKERYSLLESLTAQTKNREDLVSETLGKSCRFPSFLKTTHLVDDKADERTAAMLAGRDSTAAMLGWCVLRLALHPEVFTSLRKACLRDFSSDSQPSFVELKACRPLQHFLQEVLRLHPIVPMNNRLCVKDTTLPLGGGADQRSPIAIRAGQTVVFSVYAMHRRKDLWGEDVMEFRPSRWEQRVPAWQWLPFLGGPRVCIGQQFALTEVGFMLVRLLKAFDAVEAVNEGELRTMKKGIGLTMCE